MSMGVCFLGIDFALGPFLAPSFCFLATLGCTASATYYCCYGILPYHRSRNLKPSGHGVKPLSPWTDRDLFSL